jgi:hypothetical protein
LEEKVPEPLKFQTGNQCASIDDKKLMRMKVWKFSSVNFFPYVHSEFSLQYCFSMFQCKHCRRMQTEMADELFIRRGPNDTFVLHFCLCFPCLSANKEYQNTIFRHFSRFAAMK